MYQAALVLARAPFFLVDALSNAVFPFIAEAKTAADVNGWFFSAFQWVPLVLIPLQLVLLVAPALPLRVFFPSAYGAAAPLLRIMTIGTLGLLTMEMLLKALNARELSAALARRIPLALAAEVAALAVAVPLWGDTGAALAFAVASWLGAVLLGRLYVRHFHPAAPRLSTVVRYLLALAPLVGALSATSWLPELLAVAPVLAGLAGYAVAALGLGLVRDRTSRGSAVRPTTAATGQRGGPVMTDQPAVGQWDGELGLAAYAARIHAMKRLSPGPSRLGSSRPDR